jgi:predicted nucleotidyltransferase component of viral defense system
MIDEYELLKHSTDFRDIRQLEKDYLLVLLLREIYSVFSVELVFKGGTALKLFHSLNRFSEDLDFSYTGSWEPKERHSIYEKMNKCLDNLDRQYEIVKTEHRGNTVGNKTIGINYEISVRGPLNNRLGHLQNIDIDISTRRDVILEPDLRYISPVYADITTFSVPVMKIEEVLAEKILALLEREKMRDVYDLYYILSLRSVAYDREIARKKALLRDEIFDENVICHKLDAMNIKRKWKSELDYLVRDLPSNDEVFSYLKRELCKY